MRTFCEAPSGAKVTESDEMLAVVWAWTDEYPDFPDRTYPHRLTWVKDDVGLFFETQRADGKWLGVRVQHPDYQAASLAEAREMVTKFVQAGGDE